MAREQDRTPEQVAQDAIEAAAEALHRVDSVYYVEQAEIAIKAWLNAIGLTDAALYHLLAVGTIADLENKNRWVAAIREVQDR